MNFSHYGFARVGIAALTFISLFSRLAAGASASPESQASANMQRRTESAAIRFFIENANPRSGLVRDAAENFRPTPSTNRMASMASTGFGLAVIANAALRGLVDRDFARSSILKTLRFSRDHVPRHQGWFLHFVDWETGERVGSSEYSTIDSALFLAGALYAAQAFPGGEIQSIAETLYEQTNFNYFLTDGGAYPTKRTLSMAWTAEGGFCGAQWDMYAEQKIMLILGLGHPTHPLPAAVWQAWPRLMEDAPLGPRLMGVEQALFIHQYSELFLDLRAFSDGYANYFENGRKATELNRRLAQASPHATNRAGFWGWSAGQSADGYAVWSPLHFTGTVCIGCAVGSAMFEPASVLRDMSAWAAGPYAHKIWGRYGFIDSLDLDRSWFSGQVLGITVGPAYLSLADAADETSVWRLFMRNPQVQLGLKRAEASLRPASGAGL